MLHYHHILLNSMAVACFSDIVRSCGQNKLLSENILKIRLPSSPVTALHYQTASNLLYNRTERDRRPHQPAQRPQGSNRDCHPNPPNLHILLSVMGLLSPRTTFWDTICYNDRQIRATSQHTHGRQVEQRMAAPWFFCWAESSPTYLHIRSEKLISRESTFHIS